MIIYMAITFIIKTFSVNFSKQHIPIIIENRICDRDLINRLLFSSQFPTLIHTKLNFKPLSSFEQ